MSHPCIWPCLTYIVCTMGSSRLHASSTCFWSSCFGHFVNLIRTCSASLLTQKEAFSSHVSGSRRSHPQLRVNCFSWLEPSTFHATNEEFLRELFFHEAKPTYPILCTAILWAQSSGKLSCPNRIEPGVLLRSSICFFEPCW